MVVNFLEILLRLIYKNFFYKVFLTDELVNQMVHQTNLYCGQFVQDKGEENISDFSFAKFFPAEGLTPDDMVWFIALTYYMGVVKKENIRDY